MKSNKQSQNKFEDAFAKYQNIVSKEYFEGFKKVEYAKTESKKQDKLAKDRNELRKGNVTVVMKNTTNNKHEPKVNVAKALDPDAEIKVKEVPKEISIQVQQARKDANLNQEQLAKLVEVKPSSIKDLEAGEGAYDAQLVIKIENALKKKFDRSWKHAK